LLNRPVTAAEVRALNPHPVILFDGDSRTGLKPYPFGAFGQSAKTWYGFKHLGTTGAGLATLSAAAAANVDPIRFGNSSICVIWAGVNDSAQTAQQIHDAIKAYCLARRAAGWKVLVCTEIDAKDVQRVADGWTAKYQSLNTLLKADYRDFADAYADLGANANLQDANNVTYFLGDKVHLTTAGYTEVASVVGPALASL
jgi:lysophospholipase L1-like esterase